MWTLIKAYKSYMNLIIHYNIRLIPENIIKSAIRIFIEIQFRKCFFPSPESLQPLSWDICLPLQFFLRYIFCKYFNWFFHFLQQNIYVWCQEKRNANPWLILIFMAFCWIVFQYLLSEIECSLNLLNPCNTRFLKCSWITNQLDIFINVCRNVEPLSLQLVYCLCTSISETIFCRLAFLFLLNVGSFL